MTVDFFSTQISDTSKGNGNGISAGLGLGGKGLSADFLDFLLGQIQVEETMTEKGAKVVLKEDPNALAADADLIQGDAEMNALLKEKGDLALLQLALIGQTSNENIEQRLANIKSDQLDNRATQLTKLIDHLTNGLPAGTETGGAIDALVARLQERLENLEASLDALKAHIESGEEVTTESSAPFPLLIATGLNPAQLTKITDRIEEVENKLGRDLTVDDLIAGVGNIIPAPGAEEKLKPSDLIGLANQVEGQEGAEDVLALAANSTEPSDALAKQLNGLNVGGQAEEISAAPSSQNGLETRAFVEGDQIIGTGPISNSDFNALKNKTVKNPNIADANLVALATSSQPLISGFNGSIALPENWQSFFAEAFEALGINIDSGIPLTPTMLAAHVSTSIPQAGQMHAATQTVAANMTKAAQNGTPNDMTIQLDPPELGRVEIKLEFGADKKIKAHVVVEKPETFLLLQKDSAALDRALQNAGLETDSGSLSFEMAADDYAFGQGNGDDQNGNSNAKGSGSSDDENEEIIQTTMTWDVDPETGHVHYNIMA